MSTTNDAELNDLSAYQLHAVGDCDGESGRCPYCQDRVEDVTQEEEP